MGISKLFAGLCVLLVTQVVLAAPKIEHWTAASGARVYFVENHALPILDIQIDFPAGSARDPAGLAGTAALTHALLDLGAGDLDETRIASRLADLGARLGGSTDLDRASVSLRTLADPEVREPALDILRTVLGAPRFPAEVFEREKARTLAALKEALTRPESIADKAFWAALYPGHPYGAQATPESVAALTRNDLEAFYRRHYAATGASLAIVGALSRGEAEALAERLTGVLPAGGAGAPPGDPLLPVASEVRLAHPAAQAHVLIGLPAIRRGDPDFFPLLVGNYTLGGGGFVSRLMKEVRDKRGFAYSVHSYFQPLAQPGPFQIGLQTKKSQAADAVGVVREVLAAFLADGPSEAELRAAQQNLVGGFPLRLDSNRKLLDNVAVIGFYGLPLDWLDRYSERIAQVTVADVKAAFARRVRTGNLVTVVVGGE